jgi:hypothetical protein
MAQARENYGIDAPTVVRNPAGIGFLLRIVSAVTAALLRLRIFDIRHARTYAAQLRALGAEVQLWAPIGWRFSAIKPV